MNAERCCAASAMVLRIASGAGSSRQQRPDPGVGPLQRVGAGGLHGVDAGQPG